MMTYIYFEVKIWITLSYYLKIWHSCIKQSWRYKTNHWCMKYKSYRPTFILRSNVRWYWHIIPKYDVHTSNSLQDVTQNHWTMEYITFMSHWLTLILRSNVGSYWFILPKYDVHTSNSLQDIRQNHWNMSCWPSLHDPQIHVTRFSHVQPSA